MRPYPSRTHRRTTRALWSATTAALLLAAGACGPDVQARPGENDPGAHIRALMEGNADPVLPTPDGDTVSIGGDVVAFYAARGHQAAWVDEDGFRDRGEELVTALRAADEEGLDRQTYLGGHLDHLLAAIEEDAREDIAVGPALGTLDILLSEAFLRYTTDIRRGTVDPESAGLAWEIPRGDPTDTEFLNELVSSDDFAGALESLRPSPPHYDRLKKALARYRDIAAEGGWPAVPEGETLEEGSTGPRVARLRERLLAEGNPREVDAARRASRPDTFDAGLAEAMEHFQRRHGIDADGRVGPSTFDALNVPVEERVQSLRLNLDRWRWLPEDMGERFILVNVAGFEATIIEDGQPTFQTAVVVGQEGWETPVFQDTMEHIVVNPYWNVPESIAQEEVIPAAMGDRSYLARNRFEVLDANGRSVDPGSVDLRSGAYSFRQRPGQGNALGDVKFLFPNGHNIYLHDTPADHLFQQSGRAFSHGCIRVEKPDELARYLFEGYTDRPASDYEKLRGAGEESWVNLRDPLPVYILYFTAWPEEDGSVRFYHDVYSRDAQMERAAASLRTDDPTTKLRTRTSSATGRMDRT